MLKFLENLRVAPAETKKSFAVIVSVFVTFIIVGFSLAVSNPLSVKAEKDVAKNDEDKLPSPFFVLASQIGSSFDGLKSDLLPLKEMLSAVKDEMAVSTSSPQASTTTPVIATSTVKTIPSIATTTKETKVIPKPAPPAVVKKIESSPKYGPFLIPGVKKTSTITKANVMTIGKSTTTTVQMVTPQAFSTQIATST